MSYNEEFVKRVYKTVVEEGCDSYREIYENTEIEESNDIYYKKALEFYKAMDNDKKEIFFDVIRQTMIDTIFHILGILDGITNKGKKWRNNSFRYLNENRFNQFMGILLKYTANKWGFE